MAEDNLFYSEDEKILFWVAGYTAIDNTHNVEEIINAMRDKKIEFIVDVAKQVGKNRVVKTDYITESRRYRFMRVFWCEDVEVEDVPEHAFHITNENDWTMWKWLAD